MSWKDSVGLPSSPRFRISWRPDEQVNPQALYESLVLLEYLDDAFPDSKLRPSDAHELGLVRLALQQISSAVVPAFYRFVQAQEPEQQRSEGAKFVQALQDLYKQWFVPGATWARGSSFGWVDMALAPWIVRFGLLEKHRGFKPSDVGTEFAAYTERVLQRRSVRATTSEPEPYEKVYREFTDELPARIVTTVMAHLALDSSGRYFENFAESEVAKETRKSMQ